MKRIQILLLALCTAFALQAQSTFKIQSANPTTPLYIRISSGSFVLDESGTSITLFNIPDGYYTVEFYANERSNKVLKSVEVYLESDTKTTWLVSRGFRISSEVVATEPQYQDDSRHYPQAISEEDFDDIYEFVNKESFDSNRYKAIVTATKYAYLSTNQIGRLLSLFTFDGDEKLDAAKLLFENAVDKHNYYKLTELFTFSSNKEELLDFINEK